MKKLIFILILTLAVQAQETLRDDDGNLILPRGLAPWEKTTDNPNPLLYHTSPPAEAVRAVAEWEEIEALMVRWPNSSGAINLMWANFLRPIALDLKIIVYCNSANSVNTARNYFISQNVPIDSMQFTVRQTDSWWIRDYGPWWIWRQNSWDRGIVDWDYNRPRPNDDDIPEWQADEWEIPYYGPDLTFTGGNFMVDGNGRGFCSRLVFDENGITVDTDAELDSILEDFMNLDTVITFPRFFGIDHIDMSMKLLNDHTAILNRYPMGNQYNDEMDTCEARLERVVNPFGQQVVVTRISTPSWNGGVPYTYTNALFVNNKVLLPIYNRAEDSAAVAIWRSLLPGYQIFPVNSNAIIDQQGAIHCVIKEVSHRHLIRIEYAPLAEFLADADDAILQAHITSLGTLDEDSLQLFWSLNEDDTVYQSVAFASQGNDNYSAQIPIQGTNVTVYYYVKAKNIEGNWTTMPRYGPEAHYVTTFPPAPPASPQNFTISNVGNDIVLSWLPVAADIYGVSIFNVNYLVYASEDLDGAFTLLTATSATSVTLLGESVSTTPRRYFQVIAQTP